MPKKTRGGDTERYDPLDPRTFRTLSAEQVDREFAELLAKAEDDKGSWADALDEDEGKMIPTLPPPTPAGAKSKVTEKITWKRDRMAPAEMDSLKQEIGNDFFKEYNYKGPTHVKLRIGRWPLPSEQAYLFGLKKYYLHLYEITDSPISTASLYHERSFQNVMSDATRKLRVMYMWIADHGKHQVLKVYSLKPRVPLNKLRESFARAMDAIQIEGAEIVLRKYREIKARK